MKYFKFTHLFLEKFLDLNLFMQFEKIDRKKSQTA